MTAHINIGSNKGDRNAIIGKAAALVASLSATPARISSVVESEPWGFDSDNRFLNIGIEIEWNGTPESLLSRLQSIEHELGASAHRDAVGNYIDRTLDIDIIYIDNLIINTDSLTIPHPRMHLRDFVLKPIAELNPEWTHPVTGQKAEDMLEVVHAKTIK